MVRHNQTIQYGKRSGGYSAYIRRDASNICHHPTDPCYVEYCPLRQPYKVCWANEMGQRHRKGAPAVAYYTVDGSVWHTEHWEDGVTIHATHSMDGVP